LEQLAKMVSLVSTVYKVKQAPEGQLAQQDRSGRLALLESAIPEQQALLAHEEMLVFKDTQALQVCEAEQAL
jgi:hypothetical protein